MSKIRLIAALTFIFVLGTSRNLLADPFLVPSIGLATSAAAPVLQANGSYNITYTLVVKNYGDEKLTNVQVTDALGLTFVSPATFSLVGGVVATGSIFANPAFNGTSDINLLKAGSTLLAGVQQTIVFTVNVNLNSGAALFSSLPIASGNGTLLPVLDSSVNGNNPDPNGDGIPLETSPTVVNLIPFPIIGVAKSVATPLIQSNGSYNVTFTITIKNLGNEILKNVQVTDALNLTFIGPTTFTVGSVVSTGTLVANAGFNGNGDINLLAAGSTLGLGASQTLTFTVNIVPNGLFGPFLNSATATANGNGSNILTTDLSVDGNNPDPNGDGIPLEVLPTSISLIPTPVIGIAKSVSAPIPQPDGSNNVTFTMTVKNYGNETLRNVQVTDALITAFVGPSTYTLIGGVVATGTLVANPSFNGNAITNLLNAASSTLAVGATQTITFTLNVQPHGLLGPFANTAIASANGSLLPTIDTSVDGNNPDPNGDGIPLELSPTLLSLIPIPVIGIAKSATSPLLQADGSYNVTFTLTIKNLGNEALTDVHVTDALINTFVAPSLFNIVGPVVTSGSLVANANFALGLSTDLLQPGSTLALGATQTLSFTVNVTPNGLFGLVANTAIATGVGANSLLPTLDISVDGNNPDPNGDGIPLETLPTIITFVPVPIIGISKSATTPQAQPNGSYNVTFTMTLQNLGNETLNNVQVTDALVSAFIGPATYSLVGGVVASGTLTANPSFNGNGITNLLVASSSSLAVHAKQTVVFTVNVRPNTAFGPFLNTAIATATGSSLPTTDISVDGNNPDPNGDGLPLETSPTIINLIPVPIIGLAKSASSPLPQPNGTYNVTYTFAVKNMGNEPLSNVQITDNMVSAFAAPSVYTIVGGVVASGSLIANVNFNGNLVSNLLAPGSTLPVGATETVTVTLNVSPNAFFGPFLNTAIASGNGSLLPTVDLSMDGNNPDPNGDGIPLETLPTIVSLIPIPLVGIAKSASTPLIQPDNSYNVTYTFTVENLGNETLTNVQVVDALITTFPAPSTYTLVGGVIATGTLIANNFFDGNLVTSLLNSGSTLAVGDKQTISVTLNIKPVGFFGPYINSAIATGLGSLLPTTDVSVDGNDPDPNGDGLPLEVSPTIILLTPAPSIGVAKNIVNSILLADGTYNVTYNIVLKNYGNVALHNIVVLDDLSQAFSLAAGFSLAANVSTTGGLQANVGFNGVLNTNLLDPLTSVLNIGETQNISYTVNVRANGIFGPFCNSALATATGPLGVGLTIDVSNTGNDPDPNGNNNPSDPGENVCTPLNLTSHPVIGIAKSAGVSVLQSNGSYNTPFTLTLKNMGNTPLVNVQVTDDLAVALPGGVTFTLIGAPSVSGSLVANAGYNGTTVKTLLGAGSTLAVGASATVNFSVNIQPNGNFGPFFNSAVANAKDASSVQVTSDISTDGTNPDPNGNGNPGDSDESILSAFSLTPNALIGIAKAATAPALQANGSYNMTFTFTVKNFGNVTLTNVQVTDNLAAVFPSPSTFSIVGSITSPVSLVPNSGYNGDTDINLLSSGSTLAPGSTEHITLNVNVMPNGSFGPFFNTATASGSASGFSFTTTDVSTDGNNPDPNNNGNPGDAGEDTATTITLSPNATIGVAKAVTSALLQPNGSYVVTFSIVVKNYGNVVLNNVAVTDDLTAAFSSPTTFTITQAPSATGGLVPNAAFDGRTDFNLLAAGTSLAVGESRTITFSVGVNVNGNFGPFYNSAKAAATGASGAGATSDISASGTNPDPNGNGNPGDVGENDATLISLTPNAVIGLAKAASIPVIQADGTYKVTYTIVVKNLGNTAFTNLQVTDNLSAAFPSPSTYAISGSVAVSGSMTANPGYNGSSDINLLGTGNSLPIGVTETITLQVIITPNGNFGPFYNSAVGVATSGAGSYSDISASGTNPDPNGNGNPGDPGENDATSITLTPQPVLGVAKAASSPVLQADGSYNITYTLTLKNMGNVALSNILVVDDLAHAFTAPATFSLIGTPTATGLLIANSAYNGTSDTNLLSAGTIAIGTTQTVTYTVSVQPNGNFGPFYNSAVGKGSSGSITYTDISNSGNNPDPNGNGYPSDIGEDIPTGVTLAPNVIAGIAKAASLPLIQPDGSYKVTYTLTVKNLGNYNINNIQVKDYIINAFPAPATFTVSPGSATTGAFVINPSFNGSTDVNLLAGGSKLAIGATHVITFTINVTLNGASGIFYNRATTTVVSDDNLTSFTDISANGTNPDPNGNGNPGDVGENDPTPVNLTPHAVLGVAKAAGLPIQTGGSFEIPYTITLKNLGNVSLNSVQVTDNLAQAFPSPITFSITSITSGGSLVVNPSFNGTTDRNLLAAGNTLAVGNTQQVTFNLRVNANGNQGTFYNSAVGSATGIGSSGNTTDVSANGADPDPNGNGNPGDSGEDGATPVTLTLSPIVGLAKNAATPLLNNDGSYDVTFTLYVQNLGNVALSNISVYDDISLVLPPATPFTIKGSVQATGSLVVNSAYDAKTNVNLLNASSTLAIGAKERITFTINIPGPIAAGPYYNTALCFASNPDNSLTYGDISTRGTNPDPNGNGNPNDPNESQPTPFLLQLNPVIGVAESVTESVLKSDGTYTINFTITVKNLGNDDLKSVTVSNNLANTFPSLVTYSIVGTPTITGGTLVANDLYNGNSQTNLIKSGTLGVGQSATIKFTATIATKAAFGLFWNQVDATGIGVLSLSRTTDISDDGIEVDADGNGNPGDLHENDPTPIMVVPNLVMGISKAVTSIVAETSCLYNVTYSITIKNYGNSNVSNVNVLDSLSRVFPLRVAFNVLSISSPSGLHVNNSFNGYTDARLLTGVDLIGPGQTNEIIFTLQVAPDGNYGPFNNSAYFTGLGTASERVTDKSTNGSDPDPNNDKLPNESVVTPLNITPAALFFPDAFSPNGDGQHDTYDITLECGLTANLIIFNRWGDKVFETKDYKNDWTGYSNRGSFLDKPLPDGTYFYNIELSNGQKYTSFITIKR